MFLCMALGPERAIPRSLIVCSMDVDAKDPSLTGRTEFWPYVIQSIMEKPFLGWGFSAFWSPLNLISTQMRQTFHVLNSHNTLLELLLGVGIVGASYFIPLDAIFRVRGEVYERPGETVRTF